MVKLITITDDPEQVGSDHSEIIFWRSYTTDNRIISIPVYLEEHADRLRGKYLSFIHDLGKASVNGKSIIEHMSIADDFSFWWMSYLAEKSPFKSPRIYDCLRLLALEDILEESLPSKLHFISSDKIIIESVSILCKRLNIDFTYKKNNRNAINWSIRKLYCSLPSALQGLISLRNLVIRWPLRRLSKPEWFSGSNSIFMCSYFYHMDAVAGNEGRFYSRQWEELPEFINKIGMKLNCIHHFLVSPGMPNIQGGVKWLEKFNQDAINQGSHSFIETYLSPRLVFQIIKNWIRLNVIAWKLRGVKQAFTPKDSSADLWPLLKYDWKTSLNGPSAINNCLWVEIFDSALKDIPHQEKGLYLWENQGWEAALVYAWRKNGHARIIGVPHSTVRFWALNNFDDVRTLDSHGNLSKPLPDCLAVNGQKAWDEFTKISYPLDRLVEVEALRYQHLLSSNSPQIENGKGSALTSISSVENSSIRMLVIGDLTVKQTYKMLRCIEGAESILDTKISVTVKPHPACKVNQEDFPNLEFDLTNKPLSEIMGGFDMAFSGNTTSGGLDAFLAGLFVVIFLDEDDFNHSPLRGVTGVKFVGDVSDLSSAIKNIEKNTSRSKVSEFFWLDSQLPRWRKLLLENQDSISY